MNLLLPRVTTEAASDQNFFISLPSHLKECNSVVIFKDHILYFYRSTFFSVSFSFFNTSDCNLDQSIKRIVFCLIFQGLC